MILRQLNSLVCNLISPPFCAVCHRFLEERVHLCDRCRRGIIPPTTCTMEVGEKYLLKVYALSAYEGVVRKFVLSKNYRNPIAFHQLGELMAGYDFCPWKEFDLLVPIPLHWTRHTWRGFNQAAVLACAIGTLHHIPIGSVVCRAKRTAQQTMLARADRQSNVRGVFELKKSAVQVMRGKHVLIVDDVMTTGATLRMLAQAVAKAEPASISAVVAARVL